METTQSILISLLIVLTAVAAAYWAYQEGYADPIIEKLGYVTTLLSPPLPKASWVMSD